MQYPKDLNECDHFHRVVDCQYACPAHTPVPEYIRLIAQGKYTEAYMLNRHSNVFPGILGRVCDRPCEPACRRGRVDEEPVAICRLKRVAADFKGEYQHLLPSIAEKKIGKRIALIGAGPASLTVANDLLPLGYDCDLFDKQEKPGGAMLSQVPGFRLPENVLKEEIDTILNFGVKKRFGEEVTSLKKLLAEDYAAVFVGTGAPLGRDLILPGRKEAKDAVLIGVEFLASVAFKHVDNLPQKVLVIGGGNTAMDCARTARRLGAKNVQMVVAEAFEEMLASPWEIEETLHEKIPIKNHLLPKEYVVEDGQFKGMLFSTLKSCYDDQKKWAPVFTEEKDVFYPCDRVILAIGQHLHFPFIDADAGVQFKEDQKTPLVDPRTHQSTNPKVFFGGDAAFGPKNIIWAVAHGHEAAISIHQYCSGNPVDQRLPQGMNLVSQKMALNQWSYENDFHNHDRLLVPSLELKERFENLHNEVELGYDTVLALKEASRCLNCDVQTTFSANRCIECDACVDICPVQCLSIVAAEEDEKILRQKLTLKSQNLSQALLVEEVPQTKRVMVKDENYCLHCGLCAERCPTAAWDMQKFVLQLPQAKEHACLK